MVTNDTRQEYVQMYVEYLLRESIQRQYEAFQGGFLVRATYLWKS